MVKNFKVVLILFQTIFMYDPKFTKKYRLPDNFKIISK